MLICLDQPRIKLLSSLIRPFRLVSLHTIAIQLRPLNCEKLTHHLRSSPKTITYTFFLLLLTPPILP